VARAGDIGLQQHPVVAERRGGLAPAGGQGRGEGVGPLDQPPPLAAAAGHRLDQHREADGRGFLGQGRFVLLSAQVARRHRHPGLLHQGLGRILQAHGADGAGGGPIQISPAAVTASAKSAFSDRKP